MTDNKKIVVPEGMRMAALKSVSGGFSGSFTMAVDAALYEALRWLSENPILPTPEQAKELWRTTGAGEPNEAKRAAAHAIEWQRRIFLAPEQKLSQSAQSVIQRTYGPAFSRPNADAIIEAVQMCLKPSVVDEDEPIRDLLWNADYNAEVNTESADERVREAYRRGLKR